MAAGPPSPSAAAASSPQVSNGGAATPGHRPDTDSRGRRVNKPKCSKCGNVARSRCPYQSCKSCCAKAQNPCYIHVLKSNSILPHKSSNSVSTSEKPSIDAGNSSRVSSLRHFPTNLTRFIGAQNSLKLRRPLSRKDAAAINNWRFSRLKEYNESYMEAEEEAFGRYMQNVRSLEEVFSVSEPAEDSTLGDENFANKLIPGVKLKLKASCQQTESFREKIHALVDDGLNDLQKWELMDDIVFTEDSKESKRLKKARDTDSIGAVDVLMEKLSKARTEDDLKSCIQMKSNLFNREADSLYETAAGDRSNSQLATNENSGGSPTPKLAIPANILSKPFKTITIDQEALSAIETHFISLEEIIKL